jgi:hypothetical protein
MAVCSCGREGKRHTRGTLRTADRAGTAGSGAHHFRLGADLIEVCQQVVRYVEVVVLHIERLLQGSPPPQGGVLRAVALSLDRHDMWPGT